LSDEIHFEQIQQKHPWLLNKGNCLRTQMLHFCQLNQGKDAQDWDYEGGNLPLLIDMVNKNGGYTLIPANFQLKPDSIVLTKVYDTILDFDELKNNPDILLDDISEYSGFIRLSSLKYPVWARFSILEISVVVSGFPKKLYRIDVTNITVNNEEGIPIELIFLTKKSRFKKNISKQYDILFSDFFDPKKKLD
jgi:hypothetical protein